MNDSDEMIVMIQCFNPACRRDPKATGIGMKYKYYKHREHFCKKCGRELLTKEQYEAEATFRALGIKPA